MLGIFAHLHSVSVHKSIGVGTGGAGWASAHPLFGKICSLKFSVELKKKIKDGN